MGDHHPGLELARAQAQAQAQAHFEFEFQDTHSKKKAVASDQMGYGRAESKKRNTSTRVKKGIEGYKPRTEEWDEE